MGGALRRGSSSTRSRATAEDRAKAVDRLPVDHQIPSKPAAETEIPRTLLLRVSGVSWPYPPLPPEHHDAAQRALGSARLLRAEFTNPGLPCVVRRPAPNSPRRRVAGHFEICQSANVAASDGRGRRPRLAFVCSRADGRTPGGCCVAKQRPASKAPRAAPAGVRGMTGRRETYLCQGQLPGGTGPIVVR